MEQNVERDDVNERKKNEKKTFQATKRFFDKQTSEGKKLSWHSYLSTT